MAHWCLTVEKNLRAISENSTEKYKILCEAEWFSIWKWSNHLWLLHLNCIHTCNYLAFQIRTTSNIMEKYWLGWSLFWWAILWMVCYQEKWKATLQKSRKCLRLGGQFPHWKWDIVNKQLFVIPILSKTTVHLYQFWVCLTSLKYLPRRTLRTLWGHLFPRWGKTF